MRRDLEQKATIGLVGALSIGIGGIVGGGFFATFGLAIAGARGATPISFLIAGLIALGTAYSYIGLTLHYPGPGGTVAFISTAFGKGLLAATVNVLLVLSYVSIMSVYAAALASYSVPYLSETLRPVAKHVIASLAIIVLGLVNFAGAGLMERLENIFNIGKLGILALFIVAGLLVGHLQWMRLQPSDWPPISTVVASGMLGFLAYEGFELIANASDNIRAPERTLPFAFLGSVLAAIAIYVLAFIVGIGHLSFSEISLSKDFAISAAAQSFLGPFGFAIMAIGGVLASASAINADYFGAAKLPPRLAANDELPSAFHRSIHGKQILSLVVIGILALGAVNVLSIEALSAATSGGFLLVYAAVNVAAWKLANETAANRWLAGLAALLCMSAFVIMVQQFLSNPATLSSGVSVALVVALAAAIELTFRVAEREVKVKGNGDQSG
jgi:amino acid transporter